MEQQVTFGKMKHKNTADLSEQANDANAMRTATAASPKILTPFQKRMDEESSWDESGEDRKSRPKVNRMPRAYLTNQSPVLKSLEGPKAQQDAESMLPPIELKKGRILDRKFTLGIIALVIVINAVIALTLGTGNKKADAKTEAAVETAVTPPPATKRAAPLEVQSALPTVQSQTPPVAPSPQTALPAAGTPTPDPVSPPDLMSIINRY